MRIRTSLVVVFTAAALCVPARGVFGQPASPTSSTFDETIPPGANFDKAEFRLWLPPGTTPVRAIAVLVPGSNGDGRPMAEDAAWQAFATKHQLALIACRFTDKPHDQGFIEHYVNVSQGSRQALLEALARFAKNTSRAELATAPFLMWGMSAGGQFNYEFVAWKPERVAAFVVNKVGIYYSALVSQPARAVPGILFNEDVLPLHLGRAGTLQPMNEGAGFLGDFKAGAIQPLAETTAPNYPTAWLPTLRIARAWQSLVAEKPFEP